MDLAKIRQKARQGQELRQPEISPSPKEDLRQSAVPHDDASKAQTPDDEDYFLNAEPVTVRNVPQDISRIHQPTQRLVPRNPLEAILAGRESAGCGESLPLASEAQAVTEQNNIQEFLCFKVSDEVYGVDIMDIKELIKPREVTEVPRAPSFVSGIISLRGVIIPIIDMLDRLGLVRESLTGRERVIVVRHGESFSGLLVDEIIQVVRIAKDEIEAAPAVLEGINRDFVSGIGRSDGRMIILLNLFNIIDIHLY
ncbi:MAG: chemotaxis protein CheW [Desulfobacteraceae bacterium]|nr:chemotaxis protein CheW [Desulfobacteraceae bacterium]